MNQRLLLHLIVVTSMRLDPVHRKQTLLFYDQLQSGNPIGLETANNYGIWQLPGK